MAWPSVVSEGSRARPGGVRDSVWSAGRTDWGFFRIAVSLTSPIEMATAVHA